MADSKQEVVVSMVQEGIYTRQEIREAAGCTSGALATYLSGMRNAAKFTGMSVCPIEKSIDRDGESVKVLSTCTFEEYEAAKAIPAATTRASKKSPELRFAEVTKRIEKCIKALAGAQNRFDSDPENREFVLRLHKAQIELELAELDKQAILGGGYEPTDAPEVSSDDDLM